MGVPELESHLIRVMRLCREYNEFNIPEDATLTSLITQSSEKLASIVGHLGKHSFARAPFNASLGCNIWIGDGVVINSESVYNAPRRLICN